MTTISSSKIGQQSPPGSPVSLTPGRTFPLVAPKNLSADTREAGSSAETQSGGIAQSQAHQPGAQATISGYVGAQASKRSFMLPDSVRQVVHHTLRSVSNGLWVAVAVVQGVTMVLPVVAVAAGLGIVTVPFLGTLVGIVVATWGLTIVIGVIEWLIAGPPSAASVEKYLAEHDKKTSAAVPTKDLAGDHEVTRCRASWLTEPKKPVLAPLIGQPGQAGLAFVQQADEQSHGVEGTQRFFRAMIHGSQPRHRPMPLSRDGWSRLPFSSDGQGLNFPYGLGLDHARSAFVPVGVVLNQLLLLCADWQTTHDHPSPSHRGESYVGGFFGVWPSSLFTGLEGGFVQHEGLFGVRVNGFFNGARDHSVVVSARDDKQGPQVSLSFSASNGFATSPCLSFLTNQVVLLRWDKTWAQKTMFDTPISEEQSKALTDWRMGLWGSLKYWFNFQIPNSVKQHLPGQDLPKLASAHLTAGQTLSKEVERRQSFMPVAAWHCFYAGYHVGQLERARLEIDGSACSAETIVAKLTLSQPGGPRAYFTVPSGLGVDIGSNSLNKQLYSLHVPRRDPASVLAWEQLVAAVEQNSPLVAQQQALKALERALKQYRAMLPDKAPADAGPENGQSDVQMEQHNCAQIKREVACGRASSWELGIRVGLQPDEQFWGSRMPQGFAWGLGRQSRRAYMRHKVLDVGAPLDHDTASVAEASGRYRQVETLWGPDGMRRRGLSVDTFGLANPEIVEAGEKSTNAGPHGGFSRVGLTVRNYLEMSRCDAMTAKSFMLDRVNQALASSQEPNPLGKAKLFGEGWRHGHRAVSAAVTFSLEDIAALATLTSEQRKAAVARLVAFSGRRRAKLAGALDRLVSALLQDKSEASKKLVAIAGLGAGVSALHLREAFDAWDRLNELFTAFCDEAGTDDWSATRLLSEAMTQAMGQNGPDVLERMVVTSTCQLYQRPHAVAQEYLAQKQALVEAQAKSKNPPAKKAFLGSILAQSRATLKVLADSMSKSAEASLAQTQQAALDEIDRCRAMLLSDPLVDATTKQAMLAQFMASRQRIVAPQLEQIA